MGNRLAGSQLVFLVESSTDADTRRRRGAAGSLDRHRSRRRLRRAGADGGRLSHRSAPSRPRRLAASSASSASPPPSPRRLLRLLHAASVAERADRALCSLVCAGTSTRRDLRCEVSRSRRICPASQLTCSRTHASPALGRRHLIGAMVNTRSISSSASAAAPSPPRQLPPRHAAPCSRRPRGAAARGQRLAGGRNGRLRMWWSGCFVACTMSRQGALRFMCPDAAGSPGACNGGTAVRFPDQCGRAACRDVAMARRCGAPVAAATDRPPAACAVILHAIVTPCRLCGCKHAARTEPAWHACRMLFDVCPQKYT